MNDINNISELGKMIREYRIRNNLTQAQLGSKLGISANTIHLWETKNVRPNVHSMQNIANVTGISLSEVMTMARNPGWLDMIDIRRTTD